MVCEFCGREMLFASGCVSIPIIRFEPDGKKPIVGKKLAMKAESKKENAAGTAAHCLDIIIISDAILKNAQSVAISLRFAVMRRRWLNTLKRDDIIAQKRMPNECRIN